MMVISMEIRTLESFIQIAELQSFTRAAKKLGYTQSSMSAQIRKLETELGVQLFERINHTVKLTSKGAELLENAHQIIRAAERMRQSAHQLRSPRGTVRIAMADSLCRHVMKTRFRAFRLQFPEVSLKITGASTEEMFRLLNQNEVDLVYTLDQHIYDRNYVIAGEAPAGCHFFSSPEHPLAGNSRALRILETPVILTEKDMSYRRYLDQELAARSLELSPCLEVGDTDLICCLLENGTAISYLPRLCNRRGRIQGNSGPPAHALAENPALEAAALSQEQVGLPGVPLRGGILSSLKGCSSREIAGIQLIISAFGSDELVVGAPLDDAALLHDHDAVRVLDCGKPMGNDKGGPSLSSGRPSPACTSFSVLVSMEEVASSRIRAGGSATAARAMASSCRCPWLRLDPSPVSIV